MNVPLLSILFVVGCLCAGGRTMQLGRLSHRRQRRHSQHQLQLLRPTTRLQRLPPSVAQTRVLRLRLRLRLRWLSMLVPAPAWLLQMAVRLAWLVLPVVQALHSRQAQMQLRVRPWLL